VSALLSLPLLALFYLGLNRVYCDGRHSLQRTWQLVFTPLVLLFGLLVYTDIFSLMLVMGAYLYLRRGEYWPSAGLMLFAMLVRQNNAVFALYFVLEAYIRYNGSAYQYAKKMAPYALIFVLMGIVVATYGLVPGDASHHPLSLHADNIWFFIFTLTIIYMPTIMMGLSELAKETTKNHKWPTTILSTAIIFAITYTTFKPTHEYNFTHKTIWFNMLIQSAHNNWWVQAAFAGVVTLGVLALLTIRFTNTKDFLSIPFVLIFLSLSWLIEPRYYVIPLALYNLYRHPMDDWAERTQTYYLIGVTTIFMMMV